MSRESDAERKRRMFPAELGFPHEWDRHAPDFKERLAERNQLSQLRHAEHEAARQTAIYENQLKTNAEQRKRDDQWFQRIHDTVRAATEEGTLAALQRFEAEKTSQNISGAGQSNLP